jgi:probable rRNA maturation factor
VIDVDVTIASSAWREALPDAETLVREAARATDGVGEAAVLLGDDAFVRDLNARFRGKDLPTNVLSFPAGPNPLGHLGDVALAFGVCESEARAQGKPLADHLRHLVVHGLLHLLGYDHEDEAEGDVMEALERSILGGMGVPDPYGV